jgi:hypoxanthine phosphoribosyltransferase
MYDALFPNTEVASTAELQTLPDAFAYETTPPADILDSMAWNATARDILNDLIPVVAENAPPEPPEKSWLRKIVESAVRANHPAATEEPADVSLGTSFWHPGRLMRAVLDKMPEGPARLDMIREVTRFSIRMYANGTDQRGLAIVTMLFKEAGLIDADVAQPKDTSTHLATSPRFTQKAANRLHDKTDAPLLMIPICHGGFVAGIQTALAYKKLRPQNDTKIHPVRYSKNKMQDPAPQISPTEMDLIRENARDHTVLVFDEDAIGGRTMATTVKHLKKQLGAGTVVLGLVADGTSRTQVETITHGTWWEHA